MPPEKKLKPLRFTHNEATYTVDLRPAQFMGYTHYSCFCEGKEIASGGISRWNFDTDRAHRAAIKAACLRTIYAREDRRAKKEAGKCS